MVQDPFSRTLASGWGATPTGEVWSTISAGGTVTATDWSVNGTAGLMSVPVSNAYRATFLGSWTAADVDVAVTAKINQSSVVGGPIELGNLMLRGTDINTYYLVRTQIETSGAVTARINAPGGAELAAVVVPGVTYAGSSQQIRVRAQAVGRVMRMRVWDAANAEPDEWLLIVSDGTYTGAGWVGVRSGVAGTNTNSKPVTFTYDDFTAVAMIAATFPTVPLNGTIQFAFGADLKADPSTWAWYDVTAGWQPDRDLAAKIGRADATGRAQTGRLSFWLKNPNGDYTKGNPLSKWWPYIRKNTPARVVLDPGTGSLREYEMYVTQWIPRWGSAGDAGQQPLVQVVCNGVRRRLTQGASPLRSPLHRAITALTPMAHWALDEGSDATLAGSAVTGGAPLSVTGQVKFAVIDTPGGDKAPELINGKLSGVCPTGTSAVGWSVHFAARMIQSDPTQSSDIWPLSVQTADGRLWTWDISQAAGATNAGALIGEQSPPLAFGAAGTEVPAPLKFTPFDGQWHSFLMVATKLTSTVLLEAFFDGRSCAGTTVNGSVVWAPLGGPITIPDEKWLTISRVASLSIDHVAMFDYPLNQAAARTLAAAAKGWAGETAGNRIRRLCGEQGVAFPSTAPVTLVSEGFESAGLAITVTGTWARNSTQFHSGAWSYKSATITHSQTTSAVVTVPAGATQMSVWYKVSSESGSDFLQMLLDGVEDLRASGEVGWAQRTLDVVGVSTVTFRYSKDGNTSTGLDAAFIDDIVFTKDQTRLDLLDTARMGPQKADQFVALLDDAQDADGGTLLDGLSPGFIYPRRIDAYNLPVALTVDMAGRQFKGPFEPLDDDSQLINDETVSRVGGSSARYVDKTGPAGTDAIERYDDEKTLNLASDNDLLNHAAWRTHLGTASGDALRFPGVGFNLHELGGSALIEPWLQAGVRKRVQAINPPLEYGPGPIDQLIEGFTETVRSRRTWSVQANTSPYAHKVFVVGQDRVDTAGSQLDAPAPAAAVALTVLTTKGPVWSFAKGAFDISVDGLRYTVNAITNALNSNPFFEVNASGWTAVDGSIARSTAQSHQGVASLLLTPSGTGPAPRTESGRAPVSAGVSYQSSAWVRCAVARTVEVDIAWYTASNVFLSSSVTPLSVAANTWTQITTTATPPATATQAACLVGMTGTPPASHLLWIDEAMLVDPVRQVFTVTPVGPSAARPVGAPVRLWNPAVVAL